MRQKLIGLVMTKHHYSQSPNKAGTNAAYVEYFRQFGNVIMIDVAIQEVLPLDLLVLPGGADINSMTYGQVPSFNTGRGDTMYNYFDEYMLQKYVEANIPIFGICRGSQALYAHFGGNHYIQHRDIEVSEPRSEFIDTLIFKNTNFKRTNTIRKDNSKVFMANSIHHQCYMPKSFPNELKILATSKEYGNVEAFRHKTLPIAGVQYHPEETNCAFSTYLINKLLKND